MNVLTIFTLLVMVGMAAVARYVQRSKTAEALSSLQAIAKGAAAFYDTSDFNQPAGSKPEALRASRHFPPASRATVPANPADVQGKRYKSARADWASAPWKDIPFSMAQPQFYAYGFESDGAGTTARAAATAKGDLDGDSVWSLYRLTIQPDETFTARVAPATEKTNPDE